jgi:hypothetical protein
LRGFNQRTGGELLVSGLWIPQQQANTGTWLEWIVVVVAPIFFA